MPGSLNTEIFATVQPTTLASVMANLRANIHNAQGTPLETVASETPAVVQAAKAQPGGVVFTDDQAPVEQITDQLIIDYIQHS